MFDRSRPAGCAKFGRCGRGAPPSFESGNSNFGWPSSHPGPSGQKPARKRGHGALRVCRLRQRGPCLQKPRAYHGHSFTLSSGRRCRNMQSLFEDEIAPRRTSCLMRMQRDLRSRRSQCLQTALESQVQEAGTRASRSTPRSSSRSATQETSITAEALRQAAKGGAEAQAVQRGKFLGALCTLTEQRAAAGVLPARDARSGGRMQARARKSAAVDQPAGARRGAGARARHACRRPSGTRASSTGGQRQTRAPPRDVGARRRLAST